MCVSAGAAQRLVAATRIHLQAECGVPLTRGGWVYGGHGWCMYLCLTVFLYRLPAVYSFAPAISIDDGLPKRADNLLFQWLIVRRRTNMSLTSRRCRLTGVSLDASSIIGAQALLSWTKSAEFKIVVEPWGQTLHKPYTEELDSRTVHVATAATQIQLSQIRRKSVLNRLPKPFGPRRVLKWLCWENGNTLWGTPRRHTGA